ncbi:DUF6270 domain-containing protein [Bacillus changyiensis]|uniref:DUF6270 domain-containing protein n=1 Tax=Bacillus changyiensis TaxID=3004103 RepID=UPI0022E6F179|nr:DUF6270 domain-containing protein [Bacillus changyiensis]MDA1476333.1 DUF6270 domain-containing protein [Bacillus changyiensis]
MAEIISFIYDACSGNLNIEIKSDLAGDNIELLWQRRQDSSSLSLYQGKRFTGFSKGENIEFRFNIDEIIRPDMLEQKEIVWDCFLTNGETRVGVSFPSPSQEKFNDYYLKTNNLFKVVPYVTKYSKTLALYVRPVSVKGLIENFNISEDKVSGKVVMNSDEVDLSNIDFSFCFRKRECKEIFNYTEMIEQELTRNQEGTMGFSVKVNLFSYQPELWDVFIKIKNMYGSLFVRPMIMDDQIDLAHIPMDHDNYYIEPIINEKKELTFCMKQKDLHALVTSVSEKDTILNIQGTLPYYPFSNYSLVSKLRREAGTTFEYYTVMEKEIINHHDQFNIDVAFHELLKDPRDKDIWDLFVRCENKKTGFYFDMPLKAQNKNKFISQDGKAALFVNGFGHYSIWVNIDRNYSNNVTKIAVLGTCYSRNAFNTREYFNPTYKKLYACTFTQFHSNIISIVSDQVDFNIEDFSEKNLNPSDIGHIRGDFEKTFFENLKKEKPDYLILDFYVDACREVIQMEENSFITLNYLLHSTRFFKNLIGKNVISPTDFDNYFERWKESLRKFIEQLLKIIPEEKIILNRGRLTTKYKDANHKLFEFPEKDLIKRNNYVWDRLENYFLHLLPNVKMIDMRKTKYVGSSQHPFGKSYVHYESDYYKEFLFRLNQIVLEDHCM